MEKLKFTYKNNHYIYYPEDDSFRIRSSQNIAGYSYFYVSEEMEEVLRRYLEKNYDV